MHAMQTALAESDAKTFYKNMNTHVDIIEVDERIGETKLNNTFQSPLQDLPTTKDVHKVHTATPQRSLPVLNMEVKDRPVLVRYAKPSLSKPTHSVTVPCEESQSIITSGSHNYNIQHSFCCSTQVDKHTNWLRAASTWNLQ